MVIEGKVKSLGEFEVTRYIPSRQKKMVGPFIFIDHIGPADFPAGSGINVRPHPHIGLATISYLFEGSMLHRDSLGSVQEIFPGDVNWMTAGSGIVHSERESIEVRSQAHQMHGVQCWVALPESKTEISPAFSHIKKNALPHYYNQNVIYRVIAGAAYDRKVDLPTQSPLFLIDVIAGPHQTIQLPVIDNAELVDSGQQETAVLLIQGDVYSDNKALTKGFTLLDPSVSILKTQSLTRLLLLGGEAFSRQPVIDWNFVAYSDERIQQAKQDWQNGNFATVPNDDEYIPLPTVTSSSHG